MKDPAYFKFPTITIGNTYGPFFIRPMSGCSNIAYPAQGVRMICEIRTAPIQDGGILLLSLCNGLPTQTPLNKPNPNGYWYWTLSASTVQTAVLDAGEYPTEICVVYPDGTRRTLAQGITPVNKAING